MLYCVYSPLLWQNCNTDFLVVKIKAIYILIMNSEVRLQLIYSRSIRTVASDSSDTFRIKLSPVRSFQNYQLRKALQMCLMKLYCNT